MTETIQPKYKIGQTVYCANIRDAKFETCKIASYDIVGIRFNRAYEVFEYEFIGNVADQYEPYLFETPRACVFHLEETLAKLSDDVIAKEKIKK